MKFRKDTDDKYVFIQVVFDNEYELPDRFGEEDNILDCGAHTGSFLYACHMRGAQYIHCYEPHPENFEILVYNSEIWHCDRAEFFNRGISSVRGPSKISDIRGIATASPKLGTEGRDVECDTLDEAIARIGGDVRLLKLDIEGAEQAVLDSCSLEGVQEIVGELHYNYGVTDAWLKERLRDWNLCIRPNPNAPKDLGLFKAKR